MSTTIDCPYCEHEHEPTGSHEDDDGEWECYKCEKLFDVNIEYDPYYSSSKKDCYGDTCVYGEWREWFKAGYEEGTELRGATCINCDRIKTESRKIQ